jgi:hypothetical protein
MPATEADKWLPDPLQPITHHDRAFWNVVVCELAHMRPLGFPARVGVGYRHVAYRMYARFTAADGSEVTGLYFLRSDCDSRLMTIAGNLLTDYKFRFAKIEIEATGNGIRLSVSSSTGSGGADIDYASSALLGQGSAFSSLSEAAEFLKYEPAGIGVSREGQVNVVRITRDESAWDSRLVHVSKAQWQFLDGVDLTPEVCYEVLPIEYRWGRARLVRALETTGRDGSIGLATATDRINS